MLGFNPFWVVFNCDYNILEFPSSYRKSADEINSPIYKRPRIGDLSQVFRRPVMNSREVLAFVAVANKVN